MWNVYYALEDSRFLSNQNAEGTMDQNWEPSRPLGDGSPGLSCPHGSENANGEMPGPPGTENLQSPSEHPLAPGSHLRETARKMSLPAAKPGHSPPSTLPTLGRQGAAKSSPPPLLTFLPAVPALNEKLRIWLLKSLTYRNIRELPSVQMTAK